MKTELYTITTLTNLHVGSGEINFDVIDKQVQKDVVSTLPVIHSSSLKGAFRENFAKYKFDDEKGEIKKEPDTNMVKYIFGPENNDDSSHQTGAVSFFEAQLLTRPVRSNVKSHFNATSPLVIKALLQTIKLFSIEIDDIVKNELKELSELSVSSESPLIFEDIRNTILEDFEASVSDFNVSSLVDILGENLALFNDKDFKALDLPVLARNYLKDGVSDNLWYEEVVPKQSKFFFCLAKPTNLDKQDNNEKLENFYKVFDEHIKLVQIGANKSIGYGFCSIQKASK